MSGVLFNSAILCLSYSVVITHLKYAVLHVARTLTLKGSDFCPQIVFVYALLAFLAINGDHFREQHNGLFNGVFCEALNDA
jgi:hypothetical protein